MSDVSSPKSENNTDMKPDVQIKLDVPCDNDRGKKNEIICIYLIFQKKGSFFLQKNVTDSENVF